MAPHSPSNCGMTEQSTGFSTRSLSQVPGAPERAEVAGATEAAGPAEAAGADAAGNADGGVAGSPSWGRAETTGLGAEGLLPAGLLGGAGVQRTSATATAHPMVSRFVAGFMACDRLQWKGTEDGYRDKRGRGAGSLINGSTRHHVANCCATLPTTRRGACSNLASSALVPAP